MRTTVCMVAVLVLGVSTEEQSPSLSDLRKALIAELAGPPGFDDVRPMMEETSNVRAPCRRSEWVRERDLALLEKDGFRSAELRRWQVYGVKGVRLNPQSGYRDEIIHYFMVSDSGGVQCDFQTLAGVLRLNARTGRAATEADHTPLVLEERQIRRQLERQIQEAK